MSSTTFNPKVSKVSTNERTEKEKVKKETKKTAKDSFKSADPKKSAWKAMSKATEAIPGGVIEDMENYAEGFIPPDDMPKDPLWAAEKAFLEDLMFGEAGLRRSLDNEIVELPPEVVVPNAQKMFHDFKVLHDDPYPVYQGFIALDETIKTLMEQKMELIKSGELLPHEAEIQIKSWRDLKEKRRLNKINIELAYYHLINTNMRYQQQLEEAELGP
jgi:hypothetical protein